MRTFHTAWLQCSEVVQSFSPSILHSFSPINFRNCQDILPFWRAQRKGEVYRKAAHMQFSKTKHVQNPHSYLPTYLDTYMPNDKHTLHCAKLRSIVADSTTLNCMHYIACAFV